MRNDEPNKSPTKANRTSPTRAVLQPREGPRSPLGISNSDNAIGTIPM